MGDAQAALSSQTDGRTGAWVWKRLWVPRPVACGPPQPGGTKERVPRFCAGEQPCREVHLCVHSQRPVFVVVTCTYRECDPVTISGAESWGIERVLRGHRGWVMSTRLSTG